MRVPTIGELVAAHPAAQRDYMNKLAARMAKLNTEGCRTIVGADRATCEALRELTYMMHTHTPPRRLRGYKVAPKCGRRACVAGDHQQLVSRYSRAAIAEHSQERTDRAAAEVATGGVRDRVVVDTTGASDKPFMVITTMGGVPYVREYYTLGEARHVAAAVAYAEGRTDVCPPNSSNVAPGAPEHPRDVPTTARYGYAFKKIRYVRHEGFRVTHGTARTTRHVITRPTLMEALRARKDLIEAGTIPDPLDWWGEYVEGAGG